MHKSKNKRVPTCEMDTDLAIRRFYVLDAHPTALS